jgi:signal transduction histidine kinase
MISGFSLFIDVAPVALVIVVASLVVLVPYLKDAAARSLFWYLWCVTLLLAANCAELIAPPGFWTLTFAKIEYISYAYIPAAWLWFSLRYTNWLDKLSRTSLMAAIFVPAILVVLVFTNDWHRLMWPHIAYLESEGLSVLRADHGPIFWALWAYSWLLLGAGSLIVFRSHFSGQMLYKKQSLWILGGMLMPGITNTVYVFHLIPGLQKDFTPVGYALSGCCFLAGMYVHRLLWIMPVTRGVIIQDLKMGILVLDRHGWIVDHNKAADDLCALRAVTVGTHSTEYPALVELFSSSGYIPGGKMTERRSGEMSWNGVQIAWTIQPANKAASGVLYTLEDISSQYELRNDIDKIKNEFINQEKLAVVGRLTAGLAHEINNPLGYLKSDVRSLDLLIRREFSGREDRQAAEILDISQGITDGLDRIENVIKTMLAFSRQGKVDAPFVEYRIQEGADMALEIMKHELRGTADVRREYGPTPTVFAQKTEVNQVIFNILSNALRAIKERTGEEGFKGVITIRTGPTDGGVFCEISNNGTPMPETTRKRLFELFFTTKPEQLGHGLGLNLSKEIIELRHRGTLTLVSPDPVTFRIELPHGEEKNTGPAYT